MHDLRKQRMSYYQYTDIRTQTWSPTLLESADRYGQDDTGKQTVALWQCSRSQDAEGGIAHLGWDCPPIS